MPQHAANDRLRNAVGALSISLPDLFMGNLDIDYCDAGAVTPK